jgi:hypothetical protein
LLQITRQIAEIYIKTEIEALREICDIRIIAASAHPAGDKVY